MLLLSLMSAYLLSGEIKIHLGEDRLSVECNTWKNCSFPYANIEELEYYLHPDMGSRLVGVGTPSICAGRYDSPVFGSYLRYTYSDNDACICIRTAHDNYVINLEDKKHTKMLYDVLAEKMEESE